MYSRHEDKSSPFYPYKLCPSGRCVDKYECEICGQCRDRAPTSSNKINEDHNKKEEYYE